jgi:hypothetical protein
MPVSGELIIAFVMLAGLVGVVLPVLPGLLLIWGAALAWVLLDGGGFARWLAFAAITALLVVGTVAKYVLPARNANAAGAPKTTLAAGVVGAALGFFLIPVVGLLAGGVAGLLIAEWRRLRDGAAAWRSTRSVLVSIGIGIVVELVAGVLMVIIWVLTVLVA